MLTRLGTLTFQQKLGSMLDKTTAHHCLVEALARPVLGWQDEDSKLPNGRPHCAKRIW